MLQAYSCLKNLSFLTQVETINYKDMVNLHIWDLGGQDKLRFLWQRYFLTAEAVVFVIDSSESERCVEKVPSISCILVFLSLT